MFVIQKTCKDGSIRHYQVVNGKMKAIHFLAVRQAARDGVPVIIKTVGAGC